MKAEPWFDGGLNHLLAAGASPHWLSAVSSGLPSWVPQSKQAVNLWINLNHFKHKQERAQPVCDITQVCSRWRLTERSEAGIKQDRSVRLVEIWKPGAPVREASSLAFKLMDSLSAALLPKKCRLYRVKYGVWQKLGSQDFRRGAH